MAIAKWTDFNAADTAVASASLNGLLSGAAAANHVLGAAIDNRLSASGGWVYGDLEIVLSAAITTGAGAPFLAAFIIPALDGTNYATTNGASTAGPTASQYGGQRVSPPAATAVQVLHIRGLILPQSLFKVMLNNQLGVALPATSTSTCKLYRYSEQSV